MNLQLHNVEVVCHVVGGARLGSRAQTEEMVSEIARHHPHIIFVHMGENDLGAVQQIRLYVICWIS